MHVVIIDVHLEKTIRLICLYRSFRPQGMITPDLLFTRQLEILKMALTHNCYILGDFNLDARMEGRMDYHHRVPLSNLVNFAAEKNLIQMVEFETWSRVINGVKKESTLDHIYANDMMSILDVSYKVPPFGHHVLVIAELSFAVNFEKKIIMKRNWKSYLPSTFSLTLTCNLASLNGGLTDLGVQDYWNEIECAIMA